MLMPSQSNWVTFGYIKFYLPIGFTLSYTGHYRLRTGEQKNWCYTIDHLWRWGTGPDLGPIPGDPWGTPHSTETGFEAWPSKTTCWVRPENHKLIHLWVDPLIPQYSNLCNSLLCGTLSKALAKSIMIKSVCLCPRFTAPSRLLMMSCTNWTNRVLQDLWLRQLCWQSASILSKAKCLLMWLTKICSRVLQQMHVSDTGLHLTAAYVSPFLKPEKHLLVAIHLVQRSKLNTHCI